MLRVAYLANQFPSAVESYVGEEIAELRRRGVVAISGSVRRPSEPVNQGPAQEAGPDVLLEPLSFILLLRAVGLCVRRWKRISGLLLRILCFGREGPITRVKALLHTVLGACYALLLRKDDVDHIHVHHGYFGSWIAMSAARLLDVPFSMTLHGSDLLVRAAYLDVKLQSCCFCLTISEYNRRYILEHYPQVDASKIILSRLGVDVPPTAQFPARHNPEIPLSILSAGRLHKVKDHAFLIRACAQLKARGLRFECSIAGEGPERRRLESLIREFGLERQVSLLGHVEHGQMDSLYDRADVVVLTSRSEGIPVVLMEAMARGKVVIAPAITGIPELVIPGKTGLLYESGSMGDFVAQLLLVESLLEAARTRKSEAFAGNTAGKQLEWMRYAAQLQVRHNYNRKKNLDRFVDLFLARVTARNESALHEDPVLQQVQLPIQRHRSLPVRTDAVDALAGTRSRAVLDV